MGLDRRKVAELLDLTGGDPTWLGDLLLTYTNDTRARLAELAEAVRERRAERVQRGAHGIKGSSGNVGATQVAQLAHRLEMMGRDGQLEDVDAAFEALQSAFRAVVDDIPRALDRT